MRLHEAGVAMERLGDILDMEPEQKPEEITSRIMLPDLCGDMRLEEGLLSLRRKGNALCSGKYQF